MPLGPEQIDAKYDAILEYFTDGREEGEPWGKATPKEVYMALDEQGVLDELGNPSKQTIHQRMQKLVLAGHLENKYGTGSYELVSDPRDEAQDN